MTDIRRFHQSSPESVHLPRFALFSFALSIDRSEISTALRPIVVETVADLHLS
jgi:hypothetical protein